VADGYRAEVAKRKAEWDRGVDGLGARPHTPLPAQHEVIAAVNDAAAEHDVVVCAAGSLPGELHKLWRARDPKQYHVEYGYSCMGYEIPGGIGVKLAAPKREVFVMVGDASYLMMPSELVTARELGVKLIVVIVDNEGYASIGSLSRSLGLDGFGTRFMRRSDGTSALDSDAEPLGRLEVKLGANAGTLGAKVLQAKTIDEFRAALKNARTAAETTVIEIKVDRYQGVDIGGAWWDVATAAVSEDKATQAANERHVTEQKRQRWPV